MEACLAVKKTKRGRPRSKKKQQSLKELQKIWYKKLADSGFKDIEWGGPETRFLTWAPKPDSAQDLASKQTYYRLCERYLFNYKKLRGPRRFIWKMHSQGATYKEITIAYNKKYTPGLSEYTIYYIVQEILEKAKVWNETSEDGVFVD